MADKSSAVLNESDDENSLKLCYNQFVRGGKAGKGLCRAGGGADVLEGKGGGELIRQSE